MGFDLKEELCACNQIGQIPEEWFYWHFTWFIIPRICFPFKFIKDKEAINFKMDRYLQREKIGLKEGSVLSLFGRFNFYLFRKINTNTFLSWLYCKYGKIFSAPVSSPKKSEWHKWSNIPAVQTPKLAKTNLEIKSLENSV